MKPIIISDDIVFFEVPEKASEFEIIPFDWFTEAPEWFLQYRHTEEDCQLSFLS